MSDLKINGLLTEIPNMREISTADSLLDGEEHALALLKVHIEKRGNTVDLQTVLPALSSVPQDILHAAYVFGGVKTVKEADFHIDCLDDLGLLRYQILEAYIERHDYHTKWGWSRRFIREYNIIKKEALFPDFIMQAFANALDTLTNALTLEDIRKIKSLILRREKEKDMRTSAILYRHLKENSGQIDLSVLPMLTALSEEVKAAILVLSAEDGKEMISKTEDILEALLMPRKYLKSFMEQTRYANQKSCEKYLALEYMRIEEAGLLPKIFLDVFRRAIDILCEMDGYDYDFYKRLWSLADEHDVAETDSAVFCDCSEPLYYEAEEKGMGDFKIPKPKKISILGDSISTLFDCNPRGYAVHYQYEICDRADVHDMSDTWWGSVIEWFGGELLVNNSWSGSLVVNHPLCEIPSHACGEARTGGLGKDGVTPDMIFIFMGTNDWAEGVTLRSEDRNDLSVFANAYGKMLDDIKTNYPDAEIRCLTLAKTTCSRRKHYVYDPCYGGVHAEEYCKIIKACAKEKGCGVIDLYGDGVRYDTIDGFHPNREGMRTIFEAVQQGVWQESQEELIP